MVMTFMNLLLIISAVQDQEVTPLLIHTVLGLGTGKSAGKCPFRVVYAQWEDELIASERPRAQHREDRRRVLPYLSSELAELTFSKPLWSGQLPRATFCP